jgi:glyoxylase-like metal-dependent hydrolase (beta-lactamase superfamily II)
MPDTHRLKIGQFDVVMIHDGGGPRSVASFLPDAPPDQIEPIIQRQGADPAALDFSITPLLITTGNQRVLVDTGESESGGSRLLEHLKALGVAPEDIDLIVITHIHWDHVGGILNAAGEFAFPNARYAIWSTEWDYWIAPDRFPADDTHPRVATRASLMAHPEKVIKLGGVGEGGEAEILPGMCAVATPGHTPGHIAVELSSGGEKLLHVADAAHHWFQVQCPQWSPKFDYDKAQAAETRAALFERAVQSGTLFSAYHFAFPGVGHIVERDGLKQWEQA